MPYWLEYCEKLATALSPIITILLATIGGMAGWSAWKRQHRGQRRIEMALKLAQAVDEFESALQAARNPFMWTGEYDGREKKADESESDKMTNDAAYAHTKRIEKVNPFQAEIRRLSLEADLLGLEDVAALCKKVIGYRGQLQAALMRYYTERRFQKITNVEKFHADEQIVYGGGKEDRFRQELEQDAITMIARLKEVAKNG